MMWKVFVPFKGICICGLWHLLRNFRAGCPVARVLKLSSYTVCAVISSLTAHRNTSMLGKPFVVFKAFACFPHLRSHSVTLDFDSVTLDFVSERKSTWTAQGVDKYPLPLPCDLRGEELGQQKWHWPFWWRHLEAERVKKDLIFFFLNFKLRENWGKNDNHAVTFKPKHVKM